MYWCAQCSVWVDATTWHSHYAMIPTWPQPAPVFYYTWPVYYTTADPKVSYLENRILYLERRVQELEAKAAK